MSQTQQFTMRHAVIDGILLVRPTREDVQNLKVGDLAPDCFGKLAEVVEVYGVGDDIKGKAYVCYYTRFGTGTSRISNSLKEDETLSTTAATARWNRGENYPGEWRNVR